MKTSVGIALAIVSIILLTSCGGAERERLLQVQADSLAIELKSSRAANATLHEIGVVLDAIDKKRASLRISRVEGSSPLNYPARLKNINRYVNRTETKIARLEQVVKKSTLTKAAYIGALRRLKTELENANHKLFALREEELKLRHVAGVMISQLSEKDSLIKAQEEFIKAKENEIMAKEALAKRIEEESLIDFGNLYYAQASALEGMADRTRLAPAKKKETRREAIELYEIARSLGNPEADARINKLEKQTGQLSLQHAQSTTSRN